MKMDKMELHELKNWMLRNARPLELARWRYTMESGRKEEVLSCLKAFQNPDGGFGHGIEPDFWNPYSTPMASWAGAKILREVEVDPEEEIVQYLVNYLVNTVDLNTGMWPSSVPSNNDYPHAPWWQWSEGVQANWMFNPSVELSAYILSWSKPGSQAWEVGWKSMEKAMNHLIKSEKMDHHELNNFKNAVDILKPNTQTFNNQMPYSLESMTKKVWKFIEDSMDRDYENWGKDYTPLPLDFIDDPKYTKNIQFAGIEDLVEKNLTFYATSLNNEGVWDITWDWGQYPEAFAIANRIWKGTLIVNRCNILQKFNRITSD